MQWRILLSAAAVAGCLMARPSGAKLGMTRVRTPSVPTAVLHINGPLTHFARPVPLAHLRPHLACGDRGGLIAPPRYTQSVYSKACFRVISCI